MTPIVLRYIERISAIAAGAFSIYLGYLLFVGGIEKGDVNFSFGKFVVSGQGPGIAFAAGGFSVLICAIYASLKIESRQTRREGQAEATAETVMQLGHVVSPPTAGSD